MARIKLNLIIQLTSLLIRLIKVSRDFKISSQKLRLVKVLGMLQELRRSYTNYSIIKVILKLQERIDLMPLLLFYYEQNA